MTRRLLFGILIVFTLAGLVGASPRPAATVSKLGAKPIITKGVSVAKYEAPVSTGTGTGVDVDRTDMQFEWLSKNVYTSGTSQYLPDTGPDGTHDLKQSTMASWLAQGTDASGATILYNNATGTQYLTGSDSTVLFPTDQSVKNFTIAICMSWDKQDAGSYGFIFQDNIDSNEWYFAAGGSYQLNIQGVDGNNTPRGTPNFSSYTGFHVLYIWGNNTANAGAGTIRWQIDGGAATEYRTANSGVKIYIPLVMGIANTSVYQPDPDIKFYGMRGWKRVLSSDEMSNYSSPAYW